MAGATTFRSCWPGPTPTRRSGASFPGCWVNSLSYWLTDNEQYRQEQTVPKMIVSIDGVVIKEVQLTKDRTTLGRRPYNDIVIDNLAVSGEHAVLQMSGNEVYLEDLNSTNGTYVNGKAVKKKLLQNSDTVEIGKYKIKFINEAAGANFEKTMIFKPGMVPPMPKPGAGAAAPAGAAAASTAAAPAPAAATPGKPAEPATA